MSSSGEPVVVTIGAVKSNYKAAALPGEPPNTPPKLVFVRKTTMRDGPAAWAELAVGDQVELAFKNCAGRQIITDAIKIPSGRPSALPVKV